MKHDPLIQAALALGESELAMRLLALRTYQEQEQQLVTPVEPPALRLVQD